MARARACADADEAVPGAVTDRITVCLVRCRVNARGSRISLTLEVVSPDAGPRPGAGDSIRSYLPGASHTPAAASNQPPFCWHPCPRVFMGVVAGCATTALVCGAPATSPLWARTATPEPAVSTTVPSNTTTYLRSIVFLLFGSELSRGRPLQPSLFRRPCRARRHR